MGQWPACCCCALPCDEVTVRILPEVADWIHADEIEISVKVRNYLTMSLSAPASSDDVTASTTWYHLLMRSVA